MSPDYLWPVVIMLATSLAWDVARRFARGMDEHELREDIAGLHNRVAALETAVRNATDKVAMMKLRGGR